MRVFERDTGRGALMAPIGPGEAFVLGRLRPGFHRIEVLADTSVPLDLGEHFVDGRSRLDLGRAELPEPGIVVLRQRGGERPAALELFHDRPHGAVRAEGPFLPGGPPFPLPPGQWRCRWRPHDDAPIRERAFRVLAGETVEVVVD